MQNTEKIWQLVDARKDAYEALSDRVWEMPEICYTEYRSVAEHSAMLEQEGFRITENVAGIPTAIMGEAGEGGPVIAILGEYDALPGLSQVAGIAEPKELVAGGHGHGCGHNMLGSAALLAATAVKNYSPQRGIKGRVRYYGCPAEEGGAAKVFMVRAGALRGRRYRDHLASGRHQSASTMPSASPTRASISLQGPRLACRGGAASRPQRARCGRADECRRQLHARAHAVGRAHPLRHARCRWHRAQRGAGACAKVRYAIRARDLPGMTCADRARAGRSPTAPR